SADEAGSEPLPRFGVSASRGTVRGRVPHRGRDRRPQARAIDPGDGREHYRHRLSYATRSVVSTKTACCGTVIVATPAASVVTIAVGPSRPSPAWFQTIRRSFRDGGSPPML